MRHKAIFNIEGFTAIVELSSLEYFLIQYLVGRWTEEKTATMIGKPIKNYNQLVERLTRLLDNKYIINVT